MRRVIARLVFVGLVGCGGGPVLQHAPRPDPAVVAAAAAAIAGAATLANPALAGRKPEREDPAARRPVGHEPMPSDVLDRLDQAEREAAER